VLGADGHLVRIGPADLDAAPIALAHLEMPRPFAPKNPAFRRELAGRLRAARLDDTLAEVEPDPDDPARHPVAGCPDLDAHLRALAQVERLEREVKRLDRRVRGRSESLARQFDRVLRVLESWGYVDGWTLTPAGRLLMRINAETDLLIAEALRSGHLDGLRPAELAALASVFTYEHRGPEHQRPPAPRWSSGELARRWRAIDRAWRDLSANEDDAGLPETRPPDPGLAPVVQAWAAGRTLTQVLDLDDSLTGGDFVRHVKQLVDLLRQIALVAPDPATAAAASEAADACFRGVVSASGVVPS
jgi:ATP-dependent RNA helicase HelY